MHCDTFWNFLQRNAFLFLSPKALSPLPCSVIPVVRKPCSHLAACDRMVSEGRFEGHFNVSQNRLNPAACGLITRKLLERTQDGSCHLFFQEKRARVSRFVWRFLHYRKKSYLKIVPCIYKCPASLDGAMWLESNQTCFCLCCFVIDIHQ